MRNTFERNFRKFNLIKTFHRSTMTDERLTNLAMISIDNATAETEIRFDGVDEILASLKTWKKSFS